MNTKDQIRRDSGILYPDAVTLLLLSTLALSAFPVTQACWGEEMLLGDLWLRLPVLTAVCIVILVWNGFILMRLFAEFVLWSRACGVRLTGAAVASKWKMVRRFTQDKAHRPAPLVRNPCRRLCE